MKNQSNQVKERPIIFSGEMVKAILDGKKTMTRHLVKFKDFTTDSITPLHIELAEGRYCLFNERNGWLIGYPKCPYGKIGDRLWVRETHHVVGGTADYEIEEIKQGLQDIKNFASYKADGYGNPCDGGWTSPMFMPRWVSRILLEITDIRVERLNDISEADAVKEGIKEFRINCSRDGIKTAYRDYSDVHNDVITLNNPTASFRTLWDTLNAKKGYPWSSNPWVWVVEFKVVEVA